MKQYVPEIMKAVISLPEEQVCSAIGLCSASSLQGKPPVASVLYWHKPR